MQLTTLKRGEPDFYQLLGSIFGSRTFEKEVGIRAYDDIGKVWFCALDHNVVIGLASLRGTIVSDCYVLPEWRNKGVFTKVLERLMKKTSGPLRAVCTQASKPSFLKVGFTEKSTTKNFTKMEINRA